MSGTYQELTRAVGEWRLRAKHEPSTTEHLGFAIEWLCGRLDSPLAKAAALKAKDRDPDEDEHGQFLECAECRVKPGSPMLCRDCFARRAKWSERKQKAGTQGRATPDKLARIKALYDGWANAMPLDGGPCNLLTAHVVLTNIGAILAEPSVKPHGHIVSTGQPMYKCKREGCETIWPEVRFCPACQPKEEEFRAGLPAEILLKLHSRWEVISDHRATSQRFVFWADGGTWFYKKRDEPIANALPMPDMKWDGFMFRPDGWTWKEAEAMAAERMK